MDDTCFTAFLRCPYRIEQSLQKQHLATDLARLPRTVSPGEQWCKLICERSEWFHKNKFDIMMAWMTPVSLHLLSDFQTENTTHEFDMTKNHCRRDLQTEGWTHQQKTSLTKFGNTIWNHLAMPCFILHHPGLPNWEHNSWVWHLGWASLSNTMML